MERRGKSSPTSMVTWICCKLYPMQHRMRPQGRSARPPQGSLGGVRENRKAFRRRDAQIDGRHALVCGCEQNPAYRRSYKKMGKSASWPIFLLDATREKRRRRQCVLHMGDTSSALALFGGFVFSQLSAIDDTLLRAEVLADGQRGDIERTVCGEHQQKQTVRRLIDE